MIRTIKLSVLLSIGITLLASCEPVSEPTLRVGLMVWPAYEMAPLARELGYYDDIDVQLIDYGAPIEVSDAFSRGEIDIAPMVIPYALELRQLQPGMKIIMVIDYSSGGDALVSRPEIDSITELRGRRVGYEASALGAFMLRRALAHADMTIADIIPVSVDTIDHESAFERGQIDAVVTFEPTVTRLHQSGAHVLFDSSEIPGEVVDVLLVSEEALSNKRELVQAFVDGWLKAVDYFRENQSQVASLIARRSRLEPDEFLRAYDGIELMGREDNLRIFSGDPSEFSRALDVHRDLAVSRGMLEPGIDLSTLADESFLH